MADRTVAAILGWAATMGALPPLPRGRQRHSREGQTEEQREEDGMADEAVIRPGDAPTLRVVRGQDRSIEVHCDASEWRSAREAADFATWLAPVVDIFADYDQMARAIGEPVLTPERMAGELAATARTLLAPAYLTRERGRWRFRGGQAPAGPLPPLTGAS